MSAQISSKPDTKTIASLGIGEGVKPETLKDVTLGTGNNPTVDTATLQKQIGEDKQATQIKTNPALNKAFGMAHAAVANGKWDDALNALDNVEKILNGQNVPMNALVPSTPSAAPQVREPGAAAPQQGNAAGAAGAVPEGAPTAGVSPNAQAGVVEKSVNVAALAAGKGDMLTAADSMEVAAGAATGKPTGIDRSQLQKMSPEQLRMQMLNRTMEVAMTQLQNGNLQAALPAIGLFFSTLFNNPGMFSAIAGKQDQQQAGPGGEAPAGAAGAEAAPSKTPTPRGGLLGQFDELRQGAEQSKKKIEEKKTQLTGLEGELETAKEKSSASKAAHDSALRHRTELTTDVGQREEELSELKKRHELVLENFKAESATFRKAEDNRSAAAQAERELEPAARAASREKSKAERELKPKEEALSKLVAKKDKLEKIEEPNAKEIKELEKLEASIKTATEEVNGIKDKIDQQQEKIQAHIDAEKNLAEATKAYESAKEVFDLNLSIGEGSFTLRSE